MRRKADGNRAIFKPKDSNRTRPAAMTVEGYAAFERSRRRIGAAIGRTASPVSDACAIEWLARWFDNPQRLVHYLRATGQFQDARFARAISSRQDPVTPVRAGSMKRVRGPAGAEMERPNVV